MLGGRWALLGMLTTLLAVPFASADADDLPYCNFGGDGDPGAVTGFYLPPHQGASPWEDYQVAAGFWVHTDIGFANPGGGSVSVDWGDGSLLQAADSEDVQVGAPFPPGGHAADLWWVHSYAEAGDYTITYDISGLINTRSDEKGEWFDCGDHGTHTVTITEGGGSNPDPEIANQITALKKARKVLQADRAKMLAAAKDLRDKNDVFCQVSGQMLSALDPAKVVEVSWDQTCGAIPTLVSALVDANRKLQRNQDLIDKLDAEIAWLQNGGQPPTGAVARAKPTRSAAVTKVGRARQHVLAAMSSLAQALAGHDLDLARTRAETAADRLDSLATTCQGAKQKYARAGLGTKQTKKRISKTLEALKPNALSKRMKSYTKALGLTNAQMRKRIRHAKAVPAAHVKPTRPSDLVCSPKVSAADASTSSALRELAASL